VLLAKSLLSATTKDLAGLLAEVRDALPVPITGALSDGQETIRKAVAQELPGVPHQLCHFHYLREAAKPIYEADRHAKKELKKRHFSLNTSAFLMILCGFETFGSTGCWRVFATRWRWSLV
jgi:hypothetical protein